jgi:hypothetical protein
MTKLNCPKEYNEQVTLAEYLDLKGYCWCHVPNGGNRDAATGAKMKKQGVKPGVPDVLIFDKPDRFSSAINPDFAISGIVIELKRQKGGKVRESQEKWLQKLNNRGWITNICHGADEAIDWLEDIFEK